MYYPAFKKGHQFMLFVGRKPSWLLCCMGCLASFVLGRLTTKTTVVQAPQDHLPPVLTKRVNNMSPSDSNAGGVWDVLPMEHTEHVRFVQGATTDAFNPFHNYLFELQKDKGVDFPNLPYFDTWIHYFEAYHNHFHRFRKQEKVVFMEIGVQSGGKIPLLRDYFGPSLTYVGIDVNPSTKMFDNGDWAHIEIGNSEDHAFLQSIKDKYPHVDIFLDDGGHTMKQQKIAFEEMLPHVQPEGVFIVEDLSTSWSHWNFGGMKNTDSSNQKFRDTTMWGLIVCSLDWFMSDWIPGTVMKPTKPADNFFRPSWWKVVPDTVKHIHIYNQLVVYEKGITYPPQNVNTVGKQIPYSNSGTYPPVDWIPVLKKLQTFTKSTWKW